MTSASLPTALSDKEWIGRRLHDEKVADRKFVSGVPQLVVQDFFDTRLATDLSFDRFSPNLSAAPLKDLTALADKELAEIKPPHVFHGWQALSLKELSFPGWKGTAMGKPTKSEETGEVKNPYHAELSRDGWREKGQAYALATTLQHTFERKGRFQPPVR